MGDSAPHLPFSSDQTGAWETGNQRSGLAIHFPILNRHTSFRVVDQYARSAIGTSQNVVLYRVGTRRPGASQEGPDLIPTPPPTRADGAVIVVMIAEPPPTAQIRDYEQQEQKALQQLSDLRSKGLSTTPTEKWLTDVKGYKQADESELRREDASLQDLVDKLEVANKALSDIIAEMKQKDIDLKKQVHDRDYEAIPLQRLYAAYRDWYRANIEWATKVYLEFWEAELNWGESVGLLHGSNR